MFSIKFITNMFYFILLLQHSSYLLQECEATGMDTISKDAVVVTSTSSPILKHLLRTGVFDSDVKISKTAPDAETPKKVQQNSFKFHKDTDIYQKGEDLTNTDATQNSGKEDVVSNNATIDLSKLVYSKLASALKTRLHQMIAKAFPKYNTKLNSSESNSDITSESTKTYVEDVPNISKSEGTPKSNLSATGRQFVFHPYLPYGKDVAPDEKISIGDVLPVKMVKFFKGMVEDAPWEQMFMKMVRMIVDQFVDKIIEKMFAHKDDDHDAWRSLDGGSAKSAWSLPQNVLTYVVRSRRSTEGKAKSDHHVQDWIEKDSSSANRVSKEDRSKTKEPTEEESWLDSILDYLFPDDPKAVADSEEDGRKRREANKPSQDSNNPPTQDNNKQLLQDSNNQPSQDSNNQPSQDSNNPPTQDNSNQPLQDNTNQLLQDSSNQPSQDSNHQISGIMRSFLARYLKFQTDQLSPESMNAILKDSIRHKMSEIVSGDNSDDEDTNLPDGGSPSMSGTVSATSLDAKSTVEAPAKGSSRVKRSASDDAGKAEEEDRLWQATRRTRPSNRKSREDCSLRRACNAGRLLSRLPSVQDITMQLKAYGNEPHWDALLWGMTKKRCSRIFCKRQRSPKGTKHHWDGPEKRMRRKNTPSSRSSRLRHEESDLTTIFPV